jgi:hypothetical protein
MTQKTIYGTLLLGGTAVLGYYVYKNSFKIAWNVTSLFSHLKMYVMPVNVHNGFYLENNLKLPVVAEKKFELFYKFNNTKYKIIYNPGYNVDFPPYSKDYMMNQYVPEYDYYILENENHEKINDESKLKIIHMLEGPLKNFYDDKENVQSPRLTLINHDIINSNQTLVLQDPLTEEEKPY